MYMYMYMYTYVNIMICCWIFSVTFWLKPNFCTQSLDYGHGHMPRRDMVESDKKGGQFPSRKTRSAAEGRSLYNHGHVGGAVSL